jgi:hypothetical protein
MAYQNGAAAAIVVNGRPVREINKQDKRVSIIPFDSEYKIRLINKKNARCKVEVYIDGTDVLFGNKIVLMPNQTIDLERFLNDNASGEKFKFISKEKAMETGEILDPDGIDNGRIQIKFYEEYSNSFMSLLGVSTLLNTTPNYTLTNNNTSGGTFTANNAQIKAATDGYLSGSINCSANAAANSAQLNSGVTAAGGQSAQSFSQAIDFTTYTYSFAEINIWLSGPLVEAKKKQPSLSQAFINEAQAKIALGLSATATGEQRQVAQDYLNILSQAAG